MNSVTRSATMHIDAPAARVFPMLCPVREHDYLPDWKADILHSVSGVAELGCVFQTGGGDEPQQIWQITRFEPQAGVLRFAMCTPGSHVSRLDVLVSPRGDGACEVEFTYAHTAIVAAGESFVASFTDELFQAKMRNFGERLSAHLSAQHS